MKIKSEVVRVMDEVEGAMKAGLRSVGFRHRKRTFSRTTPEGLVHLINLQVGAYEPPGTVEIPGLRENLYGRFTVNLGVFVPEVAEYDVGGFRAGKLIHEYNCCLRARLGMIGPERRDLWWNLSDSSELAKDVMHRVSRDAFPWFDRFGTRDLILAEMSRETAGPFTTVPRIVSAIIQAKRGDAVAARALLDRQIEETDKPRHAEYVRELAARLGL